MYLKKIVMQGFKSFADKTEINFEEGITCIVGPNGSGKSNVSDAIRWVLGEQSVKTLRGNKMEDIIFAGTKNRKPLGFGEVTIVFDNKNKTIPIEYSEVSITRRIFRSGESEYYINKNSCRLKDIKKLFMDTGVGKDGYSIIGQGRVDEILSTKPEERRSIFEEAAGITKYKTRKEKAEKKLVRTEENLIRINDIVHELERQLKPLEKQSKSAKKYKELIEELKVIEINVIVRELDKLNIKLKEIEEERLILKKEIKNKVEERDIYEQKYNEAKNNISKMDIDMEEIQNKRFEIQKKLDSKKNQLVLLDEKDKYNKRELKRLEEEIIILTKEKEELTSERENLKLIYKEKGQDLVLLKENYKRELTKTENLEKKILEEEKLIEITKNNIIDSLNLVNDRKSKINNLKSFQDNIKNRIDQIKGEIKAIENEKNERRKIIEQLFIKEEDKKKEVKLLRSELGKINKDKEKIQENLSFLYDKSNENKGNLQGKISNYRFLINMDESYEGFYKSVKNVMKACKNDPILGKGVVGVVADLLKVEEKYEKAIGTALGGSLQNVVTESEEDAKKVINYLKKNRLGRVTFLPLTSIRGRTFNLNNFDKEKFHILGMASDLVLYNSKYKNIFEYLLGRTLVVENIDWGIKTARRFNHSIRIVTLDGEILNPGGSITGGSVNTNNTGNILNRKTRIEKLGSEIEKLKNIQEELNEKIKKTKIILEEMNTDSIAKENALQKANIELIKLENEIEKLSQENERDELNTEKYLKEIKDLKSEEKKIVEEKKKIKKEINQLELENNKVKHEVKDKIKDFENKKANLSELKNKLTSLKIEINSSETKYNLTDEKLEDIKEKSKRTIENIYEKKEEIKNISNMIISIGEESKKILLQRDSLENKLKKTIENLNKIKKDKISFMDNYYKKQEKLKIINKEINDLEKKDNNLKVKEARYSVQWENYHNKIIEEYKLTYEEALNYKKEISNLTKARKYIKNLKKEIDSLGTINLGAIEEYEKLKKRYTFMNNQRIDLIEAKNSLKEVIKEMEGIMERHFISSFDEIRENFGQVFSELFGGGKGDIYLEDKENPLLSGIEIIAQPPGKKAQNLSLLSGGEKSLTAVALLFAILKTKPTPFCILDEIDAALDDANINRYAKYLKEYANNTQFVIITHRKNTMEIADILYGVTMEEEGISKVVSIKLTDKYSEVAS